MIRNPEQLDALLADVRAFVRDCWHPIENKIELLDEVPADIVKELQQRGFWLEHSSSLRWFGT